jgi:5-methylcytosine-specific restriction enzyme A
MSLSAPPALGSAPPHEYRRWYSLERWRKRSRAQLQAEPLCRMCQERGMPTAATVADHIEPHRGDWNKFWLGKLQSLCAGCHERGKKWVENRGYDPRPTDENGWPLDPRHPVNAREREKTIPPGDSLGRRPIVRLKSPSEG